MPISLVLALLQLIPALLPTAVQEINQISSAVKSRGHLTPEEQDQIHALLLQINAQADQLEKDRLAKLGAPVTE